MKVVAPDAAPDDVADLTLDEVRLRLAPAIADAAMFDGWGALALEDAAELEGVDLDIAKLAFKDGPTAMIGAWIETIDAAMELALPPDALAEMKIRERIGALVRFRLDAIEGREEAVRRANAVLALPQNLGFAARRSWRTADLMWRLAGDTMTDYNHYTKRAILSALYASTLLVFIDDMSEDKAETHAFLDRRIEGVMRFEKVKASLLRPGAERFSLTRFLGRLRYPPR